MDAGYWRDLVKPVVAGRKIVLTGYPLAGQTQRVAELGELGAAACFVIGEGVGAGPVPECDSVLLDVANASFMDAMREGQRLLREVPPNVRAALDDFDPDGDALVYGSFLNETPDVAGRPCLAWRRTEWIALEDKVVIDELWDAVGIERASTRVVAVDDLDDTTGVVWAGDARDGFHGGGDLTRWIRTPEDAAAALPKMRAKCDRVRVMPFLEGIPCSIHGVVFPDYVAALRPVEMVTLRRGSELFYAGAATYWDPRADDREAMRDVARRVGDELRRRVGFGGAFTVDGVMTEDGFRPTELNPRLGAGLSQIAFSMPELPIDLLHQVLMAGLALDYRPAEFESAVLDNADASRSGGTWKVVPESVPAYEDRKLVFDHGAWRWAVGDEHRDGTLVTGPSNIGGFIRVRFAPSRTPAGPSVGERAAAFYAFCDRELGTSVGPLTAAIDVRPA
ncbi:MAG TPA: hypothetical protein VFB78_19190 [Acidimicrobiales bacterium]|nr:hypothetical protein [Acidimicrobiales bacterium]